MGFYEFSLYAFSMSPGLYFLFKLTNYIFQK